MTADELRAACVAAGLPGADIDWRSEDSWAVMAAGFTTCGADAHPLHRYRLLKRDALGTYAVMSWDRPEPALTEMAARVRDHAEDMARQLADARRALGQSTEEA